MSDDERPGADDGAVYQSEMPDRARRRRTRFAAGAIGLAAVLGAGAFLLTAQLTDRDENTRNQDIGALAPVVPSARPTTPAVSLPPGGPSPEPPTRSAVKRSTSPSPTPSVIPSATGLAAAGTAVNEHNVTTAEGTVRVVSARYDLTGQRDLLMAGDEGNPVGNARCTSKLRFANSTGVRDVPSMLLCWRTSPERSVITVAVAGNGKPSRQHSVQLLDREWKKLD